MIEIQANREEKTFKRKSRRSSPILNQDFQALVAEICKLAPEFELIDPSKIVVSVSRSKSLGKTGTWAYVTPLRYIGGAKSRQGVRRGVRGVYQYLSAGIEKHHPEALYLMTFLIPRFFYLSFQERIETIVHEIYHIHPEFRGDLRRFAKPHIHHGPTPAAFRARVREITQGVLQRAPELANHPLLNNKQDQFMEYRSRRFSIPRRIFVGESLVDRAFGQALIKPRVKPQAKRPQHPRFLERFLRSLFVASWLLAVAPVHAQDFLIEDDTPPEGAPLPPEPDVQSSEKLEDARFMGAGDQSISSILPKRFLVTVRGMEEPALRPAPGEASPEIFPVKPDDVFFLAGDDPSKEWAFLQTRRKSGWVRKRYVKPLRPLPVPGENMAARNSESLSGSTNFSGTLIDGDAAIDPSKRFVGRDGDLQNIDGSHLDGLNAGFDLVTALEPGQFYMEPNPLAQKYGLIEAGDQVTFLKKDSSGNWARIRLEITGEEGWYPAGWLRTNRLSVFKAPSRFGRVGIDFDVGYGNQGNNLGFSSMLGIDTRISNSGSTRFELGAVASYWSGEALTIGTSAFSVKYFNVGFMPRYVLFNGAGNLAGALELGTVYRLPIGSLAGLDEDVVSQNGLDNLLKSGFALVFGARVYYVFSKHVQVQIGFRGHLSSTQPTYFAMSGFSFKF